MNFFFSLKRPFRSQFPTSPIRIYFVVVLLTFCNSLVFCQRPDTHINWQNMDPQFDRVLGISTERAYAELLKNRKHVTVVVTVIDAGVDINHEDMKGHVWINSKEVRNNLVDDDKNGYKDDLNGWNFLGTQSGEVTYDSYALTRLVRQYKSRLTGKDSTDTGTDQFLRHQQYKKFNEELATRISSMRTNLSNYAPFRSVLDSIVTIIGKSSPTLSDFNGFVAKTPLQVRAKAAVLRLLPNFSSYEEFIRKVFDDGKKMVQESLDYYYNIEFDPRDSVYYSMSRYYGNNDVIGSRPNQGSYIAGIIGGVRNNGVGINGVAADLKIMSIRVVPIGDERDKDVANAILYAVKNGAKVINLSFTKEFSEDKQLVDSAIRVASANDVLIVHAAGDQNIDRDSLVYYPTAIFSNGEKARNWIEVGASGRQADGKVKFTYSNFGSKSVDVFAPGTEIYSFSGGSSYQTDSGTPGACAVVSGLAALIRSYYPALNAVQVKDVILKSVRRLDVPVAIKRGGSTFSLPFSGLSASGGIVNAFDAIRLAAKM